MYRSDVQFAWSDDVAIAYQVVGDGPIDLVYMPPWLSNLDWQWEHPLHARYLERLASFSRLIVIDRRGWGCSDRVAPGSFPSLEVAADDLIAVLDAVDSRRAALFAGAEAGWVAAIAAATHPSRFSALILYQTAATWARTDETPWNPSREEWQEEETYWLGAGTVSFTEGFVRRWNPSLVGDRGAIEYLAKLMRGTIGPGGGPAEFRRYYTTDVRAILPAIQAPTLVVNRSAVSGNIPEDGPFLASKIPDSRWVALPGADDLPWVGEYDALLAEVEEFLTGVRPAPESDRVLATVLFTDIVGSTEMAVDLGDAHWKALLAGHDRAARSDRAPPRQLHPYDRRRAARDLRRAGTGGAVRAGHRGGGPIARTGGAGRMSHRRDRACGRGCPGSGRAHRCEGGRYSRCLRSPRLFNREGPGRGIRTVVRGRRRARAQGRPRPLASVSSGGLRWTSPRRGTRRPRTA